MSTTFVSDEHGNIADISCFGSEEDAQTLVDMGRRYWVEANDGHFNDKG